ncbi:OPT oligopeptide transporter [Mycena venus]|uniref:OPT oligopeptide transporter n=1 Tax=Mycena venus TaxID=2733690 RepID=A0A8H6XTD4_9AGAR|nr:OPT oligopeptide transporter [Mycena venus]
MNRIRHAQEFVGSVPGISVSPFICGLHLHKPIMAAMQPVINMIPETSFFGMSLREWLTFLLHIYSTFSIIFCILGPSRSSQACKAFLNGVLFLLVSALTSITLSIAFIAFKSILALYSGLPGIRSLDEHCRNISPFQFRLPKTLWHRVFKFILDSHFGPFPVAPFLGFCSSLTLLLTFIYHRHKYAKDLRALVRDRLATELDLADAKDAVQRHVKQLADIEASLVCLICVDRLTQPYILNPCGHTFDLDCLRDWFRTAHPSPSDEQLAFLVDQRSPLFTLCRQKFCPLCHAEVVGCPAPLRALFGLGEQPAEESDPWWNLFANSKVEVAVFEQDPVMEA